MRGRLRRCAKWVFGGWRHSRAPVRQTCSTRDTLPAAQAGNQAQQPDLGVGYDPHYHVAWHCVP